MNERMNKRINERKNENELMNERVDRQTNKQTNINFYCQSIKIETGHPVELKVGRPYKC